MKQCSRASCAIMCSTLCKFSEYSTLIGQSNRIRYKIHCKASIYYFIYKYSSKVFSATLSFTAIGVSCQGQWATAVHTQKPVSRFWAWICQEYSIEGISFCPCFRTKPDKGQAFKLPKSSCCEAWALTTKPPNMKLHVSLGQGHPYCLLLTYFEACCSKGISLQTSL